MKIGVFDSGIGGESVANAIKTAYPELEISSKNDKEHLPYGTKTPEELEKLTLPILEEMVRDGCEAIVIACNTVTTTIIQNLRQKINVPLIGIEPMIKPAAAASSTRKIAVCATPSTLASKRYGELVRQYGGGLEIIEPDCSQWAYMIEKEAVDLQRIRIQIDSLCRMGADVIVLGCTHYHWIEQEIKSVADGYAVLVIQPEEAVVRQLGRVISQIH